MRRRGRGSLNNAGHFKFEISDLKTEEEREGSFIAKRLDGFEAASSPGGDDSSQNADEPRAAADQDNIPRHDQSGKVGEVVNGRREELKAEDAVQEMKELIPVCEREHAKAVTNQISHGANQGALAEEEQGDLQISCTQRFEHSD